jgi:hypothetical protein
VPFLIPGTGASVSASPFVIAFVWKQLLHYPNWAGGEKRIPNWAADNYTKG